MEARGKEYHDVSLLLPPQPDVLVGHLLEDQGRGLLPHSEGPANRLQRVVPAQLLRVVLDAAGGWGRRGSEPGAGGSCPLPAPNGVEAETRGPVERT